MIDNDSFKLPPEEINRARVLTTIQREEVFAAFKENETPHWGSSGLAGPPGACKDPFNNVFKEGILNAERLLPELAREA